MTKPPARPDAAPLGILLASGAHDRAHFAFVLAAGAAALGRRVVLFATNAGCFALLVDWIGLEDAARDSLIQSRGLAGFEEIRAAALELGVRCIACEAGLRAEEIDPAGLLPGIEIAGVATFLDAVGPGQFLTL
jgi:peroxiredoxin family protein